MIAWGDVPIDPIPGATTRSLLAYLIANRQRPHTRDLLSGIFWPDLPDEVARRRLNQALWRIRRTFQPHPILLAEAGCVQLNPAVSIWVDSEEFEKSCAQSAERAQWSLESLEHCIAVYRGEFMAGFYDDWVLPERERLHNLYLAALGQVVAGYKSRGAYDKALVHARAWISQDLYNEEAHREIMRLYYLLDRPAEALSQFDACRRLLRDELGVPPDPETQALANEIAERFGLDASPWLPASARPGLSPLLERPNRLPLVGRKTELAELLRLAEAAARHSGGMALLYGEAGVGKTRLLAELAQNAHWRGLRVAWGRSYELAGPPAYQPLVEVLRSSLPVLDEKFLGPVWYAELARLLPELAISASPPELKPEEEQRRLIEAVGRAFVALGRAAPCLVILEDAHWMDRASLAALRYLLPRLADTSLLVVLSVRSEELSPQHAEALAALQNTRLPRRLDLPRLDQGETAELIRRALALEQPPTLFSARLYQETEGNPFFLTETLRSLVDDGLLYRDSTGAWSTPLDDAADDYSALPLPGSVVQSIQHRLERLPASLADALGLAAVIGRSVPFDVWQRASGLPKRELLAISDELCSHALLLSAGGRDLPAFETGADYVFAHDQIRRVAYERLSPPRQRFNHASVAEALAALSPENPEALAYHWSIAQVWDQAAAYHQQAGERAMRVYALTDALIHYTLALEGLARLPGAPDLMRQYDLHLAREKIYNLQGERQAQSQELDVLAGLAETLADVRRQAQVALRQAIQADQTSDFPSTIVAARRAVELARVAEDVTIETEGHVEWGWALLLQGEHAAALTQFEEALSLARPTGLRRLEADGLHGLGTVYLVTGEYAQANSFFQQVLEIAAQVDIRPRQASSLSNLGYIATAQGNHAASIEYNQRALEIHRQTGDQRGTALVIENMAGEFLNWGDYAKARSYMGQALEIQRAIQAHENVGVTLCNLGILYQLLGDYDRAKAYYEEGLSLVEELGIRWYQCQALAYLSLLYHHLSDNQAARQLSQQGLEIAREIGDRLAEGWLLDSLGHALAGLGQVDQAAQAYQQAMNIRREVVHWDKALESLAGLARIAMRRADLSAALHYVEQILEIQDRKGLSSGNEPFRVNLTCYQVLEACQDRRSGEYLARSYTELMRLKANIEDEALERSFVENVAAHRELIAAYHACQGKKIRVSLPRAGVPGGRPLRPDEYVEVAWTVAAPEDECIPGKARRRRQRLLRLLEQAREQGAAPNHDHLAQALGVSSRTIERDLLALRQQSVATPPGEKMSA
ncbi:MAG: tetratricopeptide repeat protein [Chloroflexota bacterium]